MRTSLASLVFALLLPVSAAAQLAPPPPPPPPAGAVVVVAPAPARVVAVYESGHTGFFFRGTIGPGYGSASADVSGTKVRMSGAGVSLRVGIGGYVVPNFALYADLGGVGLPGPNVSFGGSSGSASSDTTLVVAGFGLGFSYYIMPIDIYVGGAIRAVQLSIDDGSGTTAKSDMGVGGSLVLGKEFWVSSSLTLGPALELEYSRIPDGDTTWSVFTAALTLSLTYN
ncbi:MAG: hypothetical protein GXP55_15365 [Deltaproteobacteria bacterium]|nr:hypothetical protein [Deltaproteobacteria bacterium]